MVSHNVFFGIVYWEGEDDIHYIIVTNIGTRRVRTYDTFTHKKLASYSQMMLHTKPDTFPTFRYERTPPPFESLAVILNLPAA